MPPVVGPMSPISSYQKDTSVGSCLELISKQIKKKSSADNNMKVNWHSKTFVHNQNLNQLNFIT